MRILILGASGTVGSAVRRAVGPGHSVAGTYCRRPDEAGHLLCYDHAHDDLATLLDETHPQTIVASLTGPAESQLRAHEQAAVWCAANGARLLFISTANVFDAAPDRAYTEADTPRAASAYGRFKIECETLLTRTLGRQALIVRLPLVLSLLQTERTAFTNWYMDMNTAATVGRAVVWLLEHPALTGVVHLGGRDALRHSDFTVRAADALGMDAAAYPKAQMCFHTFLQKLGCTPPAGEDTAPRAIIQSLGTVRADVPQTFHPVCAQALDDTLAALREAAHGQTKNPALEKGWNKPL